MKTFKQFLEGKLDDLMKDKNFQDLARQHVFSGNRDINFNTDGAWQSKKTKKKLADFAGLPSEKRNDKSKSLTSNFEKLRHMILMDHPNGADLDQLKNILKNIRKKGLFPEFFPSNKDVFMGFTTDQIEKLASLVIRQKEIPGSKDKYQTKNQKKINEKISEMKRRNAIKKVPFSVRLKMAADIKNYWSDGWGGQIEPEDLDPNSKKYESTIRYLKFEGFLGDNAKELSNEWLIKNGYM